MHAVIGVGTATTKTTILQERKLLQARSGMTAMIVFIFSFLPGWGSYIKTGYFTNKIHEITRFFQGYSFFL